MTTYISILRGINVSGKKLIKMDALRKMYESIGFQYVTTYIQSGNVIFSYNETEVKALEKKITEQIKIDFGFDVPVIVLKINELESIIKNNPFLKDSEKDQAFLHITFLSSKPESIDHEIIESKKQDGEEIIFSEKAVYLYCPNGYGNTKLTNTFLEMKLKVGATTRNWKTVNELFNKSK